ncbi:MAG: thioredoxin family protein [Halobacteriales archaeon]
MVLKESELDVLEPGERAPEFELPGVDGDVHSLADYMEYDAVLLVFTCNHCPYAKAKIDVLNQVAEDYDEVAVVGVNPNDAEEYPEDSFEQMRELVDEGVVRYTSYLRDETQDVAREYGAVCTPDPYLLENTGDGFELYYHGRLDDALDPEDEADRPGGDVRDAIDALLDGEPPFEDALPSQGCSIKWLDG